MQTFLVFGASGATGRHFVSLALEAGHRVRAVVRDPAKLSEVVQQHHNLEVFKGSITDDPVPGLDECVEGSDFVVSMLGDRDAQAHAKINEAFVKQQLVPAMRRHQVKRCCIRQVG